MKCTEKARRRQQAQPHRGHRRLVRLEVERLEDRNLLSNAIVTENQLPGTPESTWQVTGAGDASILGFATNVSVNHGQTVSFKVDDYARAAYHIDIYRMGYYQGNGARLVATIPASQVQKTVQPAPLTDSATGLVDAGNWSVSASWAVPATAVSGIYMARLTRDDTGGASLAYFVVRADESTSDLQFQTSDSTWQAYNNWDGKGNGKTTFFGTGGVYGGVSLYTYNGSNATLQNDGRAYKVSYNRPLVDDATTGGYGSYDSPLHAEYPMVRFLEANGYDVSYSTDVDSDRNGSLIKNHKVYLSVGHNEYWSGPQRSNVTAARDAGVNLAFFSGNESFWKTRWETSIDGSGTTYRTLVCYKESKDNAPIDPLDASPTWTWTGTWRDSRYSPPADGGKPENALSGTAYMNDRTNVDLGVSMTVPAIDASLRFWRNTSVAGLTGSQVATLGQYTVGYEVDEDLDNGSRPAGLMDMSSTTFSTPSHVTVPWGTVVGQGTSTHALTLYRAASGALVFGAGTIQWSWGLDSHHNDSASTPDPSMQQATVNVLADMKAQPGSLQAGLVAATTSTDTVAPTSAVTAPAAGATEQDGSTVTVSGTATDAGGGVVAGVEVSVDGGTTWHPAVMAAGRASWTYTWRPNALGSVTVKSRAVDDSGNLETPSAGVTVSVAGPMSIFDSGAPYNPADSDSSSIEVGVKFRSDIAGYIKGVRFYKGSGNTGTHVGALWTSAGTKLASATFSGESASGWQQVNFAQPVPINPNTTYVVSYHAPSGHYAGDDYAFINAAYTTGPLHALANGTDGPNGVFVYSSSSTFPTSASTSTNFWVDVLFDTTANDTTPPTVTGETPAPNATNVSTTTTVTATFSEPVQSSTISFVLKDSANNTVASTVSYNSSTDTATLTPSAALANSKTYTATVSGAKDLSGNTMTAPVTWSFTTIANLGPGPFSIWSASAAPVTANDTDTSSTELGVKFRSDVAGNVTGIRFYKGALNIGTHVGALWTSTGTLLASATFTGESASGWQQVNFASPVAVQANTTYVASYHAPNGHYAEDDNYFASAGVDSPPLHALANGVDGNDGVYAYGSGTVFPTNLYLAANYWVDVVFYSGSSDTQPPSAPTNLTATGGVGSVSLSWGASTDNVGVTNYNVYRSTTSGFTPSTSNRIAQPTGTTYTDSGLAAGTYYYLVTAQDAAGNVSAASNQATGTATADTTPPTAPTNLTATGGAGSVSLSWGASTDNVGVTNYNVYRSTTSGFTPSAANRIAQPTATSYTDSGLAAGTYYYLVTAQDAAGNVSPASNQASATVTQAPPSGLVAAYSFDEGSGSTVADSSGNGNTGTIANATWTTAGKYGNALSFNGTNSWVTIADSASLDLTTGMTLEAWVNPTAINGWECVLLKQDTNDLAYALYADNNGNDTGGPRRPIVSIKESSTTYWTPGSAQLALNTWVFLTATYDGSTLKMYVNGTLASSLAQSGSINTSSGVLRIGGDSLWGEYFNGLIDNIRIYNNALTQAQIQTDMNTPVGHPQLLLGDAVPAGDAPVLTQQEVGPLFDEAVRRWSAVADPAEVQRLLATRVEILNLPGTTLGQTGLGGAVIYLDATADGHGWFLDPTPRDDSEFAPGLADSPAAGRVDLLTVLTHEMGHVLGLPDDPAADPVTGNVMADRLPVGVRRINLVGLLPEAPTPTATPVLLTALAGRPEGPTAVAPLAPAPGEGPLATFSPGPPAGAPTDLADLGAFLPGPAVGANVAAVLSAVPLTGPWTGSPASPAGPAAAAPTDKVPVAASGAAGVSDPFPRDDFAWGRPALLGPHDGAADWSGRDVLFAELGRVPNDLFARDW
jgi:fibronectin type 3 domain-containing protein